MMTSKLTVFSWPVSTLGYQWIKETPAYRPHFPKAWYIVGKLDTNSSGALRLYDPMKQPALFRIFAETDGTKEGFLAFANEFGLLNPEWRDIFKINGETVAGEPLEMWTEQHHAITNALKVYDMLQEHDTDALYKHIVWDEQGRPFYTDHPVSLEDALSDYADIMNETKDGESYPFTAVPIKGEGLPVGDPIPAAAAFVRNTINAHLGRAVSARLLLSGNTTRPKMVFVPATLIGAIWLQFAQAVEQDKTFRRCQECGTWFEASAEGTRRSRLFCSNACRVKAYRNRIAEAQRLHKEEGMSVEAIAEKLGSDPATVQGWLDRDK